MLLAVGSIWWGNANYSNAALTETHYVGPVSLMNRGNSGEDVISKASKAFFEKDYKSVIALLEPLSESDPSYISSRWLLGNAFLKTEKSTAAIDAYQVVINADQSPHIEAAKWHKILAQLQNGDLDGAQIGLEPLLKDTSNSYHKKATQLNSDLNAFWRKWSF